VRGLRQGLPLGGHRLRHDRSTVTEKVGAIIVATGYELFDPKVYGQYGGGRYPDVITSMQ
jgi:heterodisulfide reductase subunit A